MMADEAFWRSSARENLAHLEAGECSAVELVDAHLARIGALDGKLRSFITLCPERARAEAEASDARRRSGETMGALDGLPFAVKDLTDTKDVRTTYGSLVFKDQVPTADEVSVARLRAAGAILLGKTNTPEFGAGPHALNPLCGPTINPYDDRFSAGGSSGGSAAAVAAGLVPIAQGTDFGGSVRTPASFCGIVGLRPTPGVIPSPSRPLGWNALVTQGVLARDVDDAALMLAAMTGHDRRDPLSRPGLDVLIGDRELPMGRWRIGITPDFGVASVSGEVRGLFERAVSAIAARFPDTKPAPIDCREAMQAFMTLRAGISHRQAAFVAQHRDRLTPSFVWNVGRGAGLSADAFIAADEARTRVFGHFIRFFESHDILVAPSASVTPFPIDQADVLEIDGRPLGSPIDYLAITYIVSLVGLPCLSIPCGFNQAALPFGLQLIAPPFQEARLLAFARLLEAELGFRHRWPDRLRSPSPITPERQDTP